MTVAVLPPRGWYDDPADEARERYWDGQQWTQRVRRKAEPVRRRGELPGTIGAGPPVGGVAPADWGPGAGFRPAPPVQPALEAVTGFPLATWGRRVVGSLIDLLIVALLLGVVLLLARDFSNRLVTEWQNWIEQLRALPQPVTLTTAMPSTALAQLVEQVTLIGTGLVGIYSLAFLGTWGATPGMRLVGLKVVPAPSLDRVAALPPKWVSAQDAASPLGWVRAIWRSLAWALLSGLDFLAFVQVFSLLMPLWHPRRQAIHDLVARTVVIRYRL